MKRRPIALAVLAALTTSLMAAPAASADGFDIDLPPGFDRPSVEPDDGFGLPPLLPPGVTLEPAAWVFAVDTTVDAPDAAPGDGRCEADIDGDERCTLRAAVEEANATKEFPTIWLPHLGEAYGLELGVLSLERPMTIQGDGRPLIRTEKLQRIFDISAGSVNLTNIMDLAVSGGFASDGGIHPSGGNILIRKGSRVRLLRLLVTEGTASIGGGIAVTQDSIAIIEDSSITGNSTTEPGRARGSQGGGIAIFEDSDVVIRRTWIESNRATYGGGIVVSSGSLVLDESVVERNQAEFSGGGLTVLDKGAVTIVDTQIMWNEAGLYRDAARLPTRYRVGGGLYIHSPYVSIENSTISDNTVVHPGTRFRSPDCHTVLADAGTFALTSIGSGNVIGDLGDECAVIDR